MKIYKRISPWFIALSCIYPCSSSCFPDRIAGESDFALVDSLIQQHKINENTLMLSFGAESISAIQTDKGIVVIDAGISTGLTGLFREKIEHAFQGSPFTYVINTHAHHDHCRGNSVFPEAEIVGQLNGTRTIDDQWKDPKRMQQFLRATAREYAYKLKDCVPYSDTWYDHFYQYTRYQQAYKDAKAMIPLRNPDMVFADDCVIDMGNITFEMKYFGHCHSNSDILIHIPEHKLLFVGDLMYEYGRPSIRDTTLSEKEIWHKSLAWTEERMDQIETVIGGHGQLFSVDDLKAFVGIMYNMSSETSHENTP
jgi:glyoxylase-like metal-dependent hydrolase (beta-lactamase superfamily II)